MTCKKKFTAKHFKTNKVIEFDQFYTMKQAKYFNPYFVDWKEIL